MRAVFALVLAAAVPAAFAEPSLVLNHTGRLQDMEDKPLTGQVRLDFELHTEPGAGGSDQVVWNDSYTDVSLSPAGFYTVVLGDTSTAGGTGHTALAPEKFTGDRWLALKVNGQAMTPWLRVGAVPYALLAGKAVDSDKLAGLDLAALDGHYDARYDARFDARYDARYLHADAAAGFARLDPPSPQVGGLRVSGEVEAGALTATGAIEGASLAVTGGIEGASLSVAGDIESATFQASGNIETTGGTYFGNGSGLTHLNATKLEGAVPAGSLPANLAHTDTAQTFTGNQAVSGNVTATQYFGDGSALTGITAGFANGGENAGAARTLGNKDAFALGLMTGNATRISIDAAGNVGIGLTNPKALLELNGGLRIGATNTCDANNFGTLRFANNRLEICSAGNWKVVATAVATANVIESDGAGGRRWTDGTYAESCEGYRHPATIAFEYNGLTGDGVYTIKPATLSTTFKVYCDMTIDNGGWTLVARGQGPNYSGWATTADLNLSASTGIGSTFKFADATINAIPKTFFRYKGDGAVQEDWFFDGRCAYGHLTASTGYCLTSYPNSDLTSDAQVGTFNSGHYGMGDWMTTRDWLHTNHGSGYWYFRKPLTGNQNGDGVNSCNGSMSNCNVTIAVK
jgi:hypothetical protein